MSSVTLQMILAFGFGLVFIITALTLAVRVPSPTSFQYAVFRIVLALAAAGVAAMIPGFINLDVTSGAVVAIRAGGALAVFAIVFFFKPAALAEAAHANSVSQPPAPPAALPNGQPFPPEKRDAFTDVWCALGDVYVAGETLWREVSSTTLSDFAKKLARAQERVVKYALFFTDADYEAITQALNAANFYFDGKRQLSELYEAEGPASGLDVSVSDRAVILQNIHAQIETNRRWLGEYREVLARLRSSLSRTLVA